VISQGRFRTIGSIVIGAGVALVVLLAPIALLAFSPIGDCFSEVCQRDRGLLVDLAKRQTAIAFGWLPVALALGLAGRRRPWLWLIAAVLCGLVSGASLLFHLEGAQTSISTPVGIAVLEVSPSFYAWLPGSFCLAVGALIRWAASRSDNPGPTS
jgi:hypothetical protein